MMRMGPNNAGRVVWAITVDFFPFLVLSVLTVISGDGVAQGCQ